MFDFSRLPPVLAQNVEGDLKKAWATLYDLWDGLIAALPKIGIAAVVFVLFYVLAWGVRWGIQRMSPGKESSNVGEVLGRLGQWVMLILGLMIAIGIVSPSITPAKFLGALGIGSVAIGFAFKDILQNFLAGILILLRQPFSRGDQVVFGDHEGTVESIDTRNTILKTYDGRRVQIPNGQVYTNPMVVLTAFDARRTRYDVGIGYGDDLEAARTAILETVAGCEGVLAEPAPDVLCVALGDSTINLRARWWSDPRRAEIVAVEDRVVSAIKKRLDDDGVDMPYPTNVMLFHDQTEEVDGDRTSQREGWPAGRKPPRSRQARREEREAERSAADKNGRAEPVANRD